MNEKTVAVLIVISIFISMTCVFIGGWSIGHIQGYYEGHVAGYQAAALDFTPPLPCHGKKNCEYVD